MTTTQEPSAVNPYFYGVPVRDPRDFFGREEQLRAVFEALQKRASVSLVGQRRSGKTSTLYHLMTDSAQRAHGFDKGNFVFIYLDPQLGIRDPQEFYEELVEALAEQVPMTERGVRGKVGSRHIRYVLDELHPRRLVLMVDEFERLISNENFPIDFFSFLRGLSGTYEVCYITTTVRRLWECYWGEWKSSPLYNIFQRPLYLGSWTMNEFDHFLAETSKRSGAPIAEHRNEIHELAGRFPFYVQMACSSYFEVWRGRGEINAHSRAEVRQRFVEAATPYFERAWKSYLQPEERAVLVALAEGNEPSNDSTLAHLVDSGYVVEGHIFSRALADFVLRQAKEPVGLRPSPNEPGQTGVWVDRKAGDVWVDGARKPPLTNLEYQLLLCLYDNTDCICDKYDIVENVWGGSYIEDVDDSRIAKLVSRLREAVEPNPTNPRYIITVHGRGYKLVSEANQE